MEQAKKSVISFSLSTCRTISTSRFSDNDNNEKERVSPTSPPATNFCDTISEEPEEENAEATQRATAATKQVYLTIKLWPVCLLS